MVLIATQVKRRRGTTAENDVFTGAEGEITVDTEKHELRVHDGMTQGGHIIPTNETLDFANKALDNLSQEGEARFTNKADSDLSNTPSNIDYVIESQEPTADNGYIWYRKYKSGWVEQGGQLTTLSTTAQTITFPMVMSDTSYFASANYAGTTQTSSPYSVWIDGATTNSIRVRGTNSTAVNACKWQVSGMSA